MMENTENYYGNIEKAE